MDKDRDLIRVDELPLRDYRPLTKAEMSELVPLRLYRDTPAPISRFTLALLLAERDRLIMATESAYWMLDCLDAEQILGPEPVLTDEEPSPPEIFKAVAVLRVAIQAAKGVELIVDADEEIQENDSEMG